MAARVGVAPVWAEVGVGVAGMEVGLAGADGGVAFTVAAVTAAVTTAVALRIGVDAGAAGGERSGVSGVKLAALGGGGADAFTRSCERAKPNQPAPNPASATIVNPALSAP